MLRSLGLLALVAGAIALVWYDLGRPIPMPPSPLGSGEKLTCISYAPFHGDQAPYTWNLRIPDRQIAGDLQRLAELTSCVRTYSAKGPQGRIAKLAAGYGLEVLQGIWLGRNRAENRREIEAALALARRHPDTIKALIVGSETLLRGELPPARIKAYLEEVRRRSGLPVTYADVWEFWLKAPELVRAPMLMKLLEEFVEHAEQEPENLSDDLTKLAQIARRIISEVSG